MKPELLNPTPYKPVVEPNMNSEVSEAFYPPVFKGLAKESDVSYSLGCTF